MTNLAQPRQHRSVEIAASWLTLRRLRGQAVVLALCLWGVCAIDFTTPGLFDRAGNLKFQDFIQFPIAARLIARGQADRLYDDQALAEGIRAIVGRDTRIHLQYLYGPQVALPFLLFGDLSFLEQAEIWVTFSLLLYIGCIYLVWKSSRALRKHSRLVVLCAAAYPPVFHFFVRGHLSAAILVCFIAAYVAFLGDHDWLAGIALGFLAFKPQFLVAIPLVFLCARAWPALLGLVASAGAQLAFTSLYFGRVVMRDYIDMLLHSAGRPGSAELSLSPIQMHSLHTFWELLMPWPNIVWALYILSSLIVIGMAGAVWKSSSPLALRFSGLILAAVLVNPHIYIYDLLALAPAFLLLDDWVLDHPEDHSTPLLRILLYLAFVLPLIGPLSRWTHVQLSVPAFALLLWVLWRLSREAADASLAALASSQFRVV
jgi:alpha-1,2-mannosyltransferase